MEDASADRERWACPHAVPKCGLLDVHKAPNPSHRCGACGFLYCGICAGDGGAFTCGVCARGSDCRAWGSDDDTEADDGGAGGVTKAKAVLLLAAAEAGGPRSAGDDALLSAYCAFARTVRNGNVAAAELQAAGWADAAEVTRLQMQVLAKRSIASKRGGGAAGPKRGGGGFGEVSKLILLDTRSCRAALGTKPGDWMGVLVRLCAR